MPTPNEILYRDPPAFASKRQLNSLAVVALALSFAPLICPAAFPVGWVAQRQIRQSQGTQWGIPLALIGMFMGAIYGLILLGGLILILLYPVFN